MAPGHTVTGLLWQKGWQGSRLPGIEIAAHRFSAGAAIVRVTLTGHLNPAGDVVAWLCMDQPPRILCVSPRFSAMTETATRMMWASDTALKGAPVSVWGLPGLGFPVISGLPYRPSGLTYALTNRATLRNGLDPNDPRPAGSEFAWTGAGTAWLLVAGCTRWGNRGSEERRDGSMTGTASAAPTASHCPAIPRPSETGYLRPHGGVGSA